MGLCNTVGELDTQKMCWSSLDLVKHWGAPGEKEKRKRISFLGSQLSPTDAEKRGLVVLLGAISRAKATRQLDLGLVYMGGATVRIKLDISETSFQPSEIILLDFSSLAHQLHPVVEQMERKETCGAVWCQIIRSGNSAHLAGVSWAIFK